MEIVHDHITIRGQSLAVQWLRQEAPADPNRPVLVFLHEALGCIDLWRDFPAALCRLTGCDGFVYDRQGHGRSAPLAGRRSLDYLNAESWEVLPAVLAAQRIGRPLLIGHSDGGTIALLYASRFGGKCAGLVTMAAHVFVDEVTLAGIHGARNAYRRTGLRERLAKYHGEKTDALFAAWAETWCASGFRSWNILPLLPDVRCPVLTIQGLEDPYGTEAQLDRIARGVGGIAQRLLIPGCGHLPHIQTPRAMLEAIQRFLEEIADVRSHQKIGAL